MDSTEQTPDAAGPPTELEVLRIRADVQRWRDKDRDQPCRIGLVPTMGGLHQGHKNLMMKMSDHCDEFCVSIFVNPTQFGPSEDFAAYPRPFLADLRQLRDVAAQIAMQRRRGRLTAVFAPRVATMYPYGLESPSAVRIDPRLSQVLEGKSRPHFFEGVATVVMKLFNLIQPHAAVFGRKDFQQLIVLQHMVQEFGMSTQVIPHHTVREPSGLAMSSRNRYLGARRRGVATVLVKALYAARGRAWRGFRDREAVLGAALEVIEREQQRQLALPPSERASFTLDYMSLASPRTLKELSSIGHHGSAIISGAIVMLPLEEPQADETDPALRRPVRLIDNMRTRAPKETKFMTTEAVDSDSGEESEGSFKLEEQEAAEDVKGGSEGKQSPLERMKSWFF